jgi:hypothetical protein
VSIQIKKKRERESKVERWTKVDMRGIAQQRARTYASALGIRQHANKPNDETKVFGLGSVPKLESELLRCGLVCRECRRVQQQAAQYRWEGCFSEEALYPKYFVSKVGWNDETKGNKPGWKS